jgi:hypothetical protein
MVQQALRRHQRDQIPATNKLAAYRADPARLMIDAGFAPDSRQAELLRSTDPRILICAARQVGKSGFRK